MATKKEIDEVVKLLSKNIITDCSDSYSIADLISEDELRSALEHYEFKPMSMITKNTFGDLERLTPNEYAAKYHEICFENYPEGPHQKGLSSPFKLKIAQPEYANDHHKECEICGRTSKQESIISTFTCLPPNNVVYFDYCKAHDSNQGIIERFFKEKQEKVMAEIKRLKEGK